MSARACHYAIFYNQRFCRGCTEHTLTVSVLLIFASIWQQTEMWLMHICANWRPLQESLGATRSANKQKHRILQKTALDDAPCHSLGALYMRLWSAIALTTIAWLLYSSTKVCAVQVVALWRRSWARSIAYIAISFALGQLTFCCIG